MKRRVLMVKGASAAALAMVGCQTTAKKQGADTETGLVSDTSTSTDTGPPIDDGSPFDNLDVPPAPEECSETERDIEGPYYLEDIPIRDNLDIYGEDAQRIGVYGYVCDAACQPIPFAIIEVWHANSIGEYDLTSSEMKYYGQLAADETGFYRFTSIIPGAYETGPDDYRPKHYHVKVWVNGEVQLTTQLYFEGDEFLSFEPDTPDSLILKPSEGPDVLAEFNFMLGQ